MPSIIKNTETNIWSDLHEYYSQLTLFNKQAPKTVVQRYLPRAVMRRRRIYFQRQIDWVQLPPLDNTIEAPTRTYEISVALIQILTK